jgi:hypothetical protein
VSHEKKTLDGKVTMHGRLVVRKIAADGSDAIRVADDQRQSVSADLGADGQAQYEVTGRSRQGEEGVLQVCQILAQRLRRDDSSVGAPRMATSPETGVDCEIPVHNGFLPVQITRPATPDFWRRLNRDAVANRSISLTDAVQDLIALIEAKAKKTSPMDRALILLALDATETAVHAMPLVAQAARRLHGADIGKHGFKSVWIVGPSDDLVFRVDEVSG